MKAGQRTGWTIFRWPLALAFTTITGLAIGLLCDGKADILACWFVASPLVAIGAIRLVKARR